MILMILICVLSMIFMVFIYVYYRLFTRTNLIDVMQLFFTVFSFHLPIFDKNSLVSVNIHPEITTPIFRKNHQFIVETGRILVFLIFTIPPSSIVSFERIFQKLTELSDFSPSAEFSNTGQNRCTRVKIQTRPNPIFIHNLSTKSIRFQNPDLKSDKFVNSARDPPARGAAPGGTGSIDRQRRNGIM
jgi:hypothetical protein